MPFKPSPLMRRRKSLVGLLLLFLGGFAPQAEADYLVSNLSSSLGYNTQSGYNLIGPQAIKNVLTGYAIGVRFTISGTQSMAFDAAQLALVYRGGTNALNISLMTDQSGIPSGTALETIRITGINATPGLVTVNSALHPILSVGVSYWLVASYGEVDTNIAWLFNSLGRSGLAAYRPDMLNATGSWIAAPALTDAAYSISGSARPAVAAVDTPSSGVLSAIAGLGLVGGQQLRRRRPVREAVTV